MTQGRQPPVRAGAGVLAVVALWWLGGCASSGPTAVPDVPEFRGASTEVVAMPDPSSLLALDAEMAAYAADLRTRYDNPRERTRRLAADLLAPASAHFIRYRADATISATDAFHTREANCLSFTALVVALGRAAGLDVRFQDVPMLPHWHVTGNAFAIERHVNARVRLGAREAEIDLLPAQDATRSGATLIEDANAIAQFYGNLGVERFAAGDLEGAYRLYRRGLEVDPRASTLWINLGVVLARHGQPAAAEQAYRATLAVVPNDLSALGNLALLYERQGDAARAAEYQARVERYRLSNPYYLYWLGERSLRDGDATAAVRHFSNAVRLMPEEAEFRLALASGQFMAGNVEQAERSLEDALRRAATDEDRASYRERFEALRARTPTG